MNIWSVIFYIETFLETFTKCKQEKFFMIEHVVIINYEIIMRELQVRFGLNIIGNSKVKARP